MLSRDLVDDGEPDPGNKRYYARMAASKDQVNTVLLPLGGRVSYLGVCCGSLTAIWHYGKSETGFAGGGTAEAVIESVCDKVFGGL